MTSTLEQTPTLRFRGPHLGLVALAFVALFVAALFPVTAFGGTPYFPGPAATIAQMVDFFSRRQSGVLLCAFLQFGSAIPLGIFTATVVSQLRFLGVRAAGTHIALFGGFLTATNIMITSSILWAMTYPGVADDPALTQALYRISFGLGGPGFSVPFGILLAGVSVTAAFHRLLPKWLVVAGLVLAIIGELSWFQMINIKLLPLIPLTRFPGYLWMIAAGFALPRRRLVKASA
ncbi:hypothetical protein [Edaphobacter aggregans]|uniref:hypothetical protein n=1 Tax=Edaphobacter aggregans TaxID=570835 RepID=UPI000555621A|nr:hypothetical protein [Edaphobacter aggregans]